MTLLSRGVGARGRSGERPTRRSGRPTRPFLTTGLCFVVGVVTLLVLPARCARRSSRRSSASASRLSLVVLTGYVGQVSLAQMSFAGVSAFKLSAPQLGMGLGFPFVLLVAALIAVPLGLLIGLPALRVRGVNLAVMTLAAAFAVDALVFNDEGFTGGLRGKDMPSPHLFGWDSGSPRATRTRG